MQPEAIYCYMAAARHDRVKPLDIPLPGWCGPKTACWGSDTNLQVLSLQVLNCTVVLHKAHTHDTQFQTAMCVLILPAGWQ